MLMEMTISKKASLEMNILSLKLFLKDQELLQKKDINIRFQQIQIMKLANIENILTMYHL